MISLPLKRNFAKANAASEDRKMVQAVYEIATNTELR